MRGDYYFFPDACNAVTVPIPRVAKSIDTIDAILHTGVSFIASHMSHVVPHASHIDFNIRFRVSISIVPRSPSRSFSQPLIAAKVALYAP